LSYECDVGSFYLLQWTRVDQLAFYSNLAANGIGDAKRGLQ
jgi:hypothetical protein